MNAKFLSLLFSTTLAGVVLVSLVDAAAKSFVLLGLAVVVCLALRRASAATRHLIWFSTLGAALALPVLSLCVPQWRVLPEWMDVVGGGRNAEPFAAAFAPLRSLPENPQAKPLPPGDLFPPADQLTPVDKATEQALKSLGEAGLEPQDALIRGWFGLGWLMALSVAALVAIALLTVWGIGAVVLLWPMVRSVWSLRRLTRSLRPVADGPVAAAMEKVARELGVKMPRVYFGSTGAMPMVWGVRRGRLLLPAEATEWDAVRLRAVLLHELAHLRRYDPLTQAIAQVARALHWFNPLAWLALRNLRVEQERACDDYVLRGGVKPSDYAGHVLELATQLQPAPRAASVALAMADRTRIEGRLHTILDAARDRRSVSRWLAAVTVLTAGLAALSLAMLQAADGKSGDVGTGAAAEQPANVGDDGGRDEVAPAVGHQDAPAAAQKDAGQQVATSQGMRHFPTAARVGTIACSADGRLVAVANDGPTFNMQVGGKRIVVDNWRPSVEILDAVTGKSVVSLKLTTADEDAVLAQTERVPEFEVRALAFSPNGSVLAVGTTVGQVKLFDARTGKLLQSLDDAKGKLADRKTPEKLKSLTRAMGGVESLAFSPDGSLLAVCGESFADSALVWDNVRRLTRKVTGPGRLEVWEVKTAKLKHDLIGHSHALAVAFSPDGNSLASAGRWTDGSDSGTGVILWNPQTGAKFRTIAKETNGFPRSVAFSPDSKLITFASVIHNDGSDASATAVSLAHVGTGNVAWQHTIPASAKLGFFSMSVQVLCDGQSLRFLRPADGTLQGVIVISADDSPGRWNALATAKRDSVLVLGGVDDEGKGRVQIWDVSSDSAPVKGGESESPSEVVWRRLGLRLSSIDADDVRRFKSNVRGGMFVAQVQPNSPSGHAGLKVGDILLGLHKWETLKYDNIVYVLTKNDETPFHPLKAHVLRGGETYEIELRIGTPAEKRDRPAATRPENKHVQELFKLWQASARADGRIPGGLIGQLGAKVEEFVRNNRNDFSGAPYAKKVEPILPRFHANHDWLPDLALGLLNDLAALSTIPIETTLWADAEQRVYPGQPLPAELKDAPWGEPTAEGLRAARPLDPRAESYPVGMALRSRILLHNDGKEPVLVRTESFMQPGYAARDAKGNSIEVTSTYWTTLANVQTWRLAPGEFVEITTPGLGVGKGAGKDEWADVRVGSWIDVADGVDVTLSPASIDVDVHMFHGEIPASRSSNGRELKLAIIRERLERERPLPASAADRELVVRRVTKDIFGDEPTADEITAFVTDKSDDPFTALANGLLRRPGLAAFVGEVKPGEITFRTTPTDPDAANRPKVAIGPGRFTLDKHVRLNIEGKPVDGRRTSDVEIRFWGEKATDEPPGPPYKIAVPDGFGTWAITCRPGTGVLYLLTEGAVRKIDYSNPATVKETSIKRGSRDDMPDEFREAVKRILTISNVPADQIKALLAGSASDE